VSANFTTSAQATGWVTHGLPSRTQRLNQYSKEREARDVAEGLKRLLKELEKQIPSRLKPAGDDNGKGLVGMTEVTP